ncbi:MAG: electron transport complex subunit RsxC [Desulfuromonas sp.]|nr:electron transport complex subunit RsxC [Desulfuromonas sp.]
MLYKSFTGGIALADRKLAESKLTTRGKAIEVCPIPEQLIIPMVQHIGTPAQPIVGVGDLVLKGQIIGQAGDFISVPIHASTSGRVTAVEPRWHSSGKELLAVVIEADGADRWDPAVEELKPELWTPDSLRQRIRAAGIVGLGGACFPTHVKLTSPADKPITTLLINGSECEPFLSADHRVLLEQTERVVDGIEILRQILAVKRVIVGIEANKEDAIARMQQCVAGRDIEVQALAVKYPQGAEQLLVAALLGLQVPNCGLPMDLGVVVHNVATAAAVSAAVRYGHPLIERVVTVSGPGITCAKNLLVRIGTPLQKLVDFCAGPRGEIAKIITGGVMTGQSQISLAAPVIPGTLALLLFGAADLPQQEAGPCIRCGRCAAVCPLHLLPTAIADCASLGRFDDAQAQHVMNCMECGCCSFLCPAYRPLVQSIRYAKAGILAQQGRA